MDTGGRAERGCKPPALASAIDALFSRGHLIELPDSAFKSQIKAASPSDHALRLQKAALAFSLDYYYFCD